MTLTDDELRTETFAERRRLADLLGGLTPEQWAHPSLCEGWRVREVVAHITLAYRHSGLRVVAGILASGGNFNRYADKIARKDTATTSDAELLESLRDNAEHPWTPPRGGQAGALAHDVLHGLDITEPLGLQSAPPARIAAAIGDPDKRQLKYFGVDLTGVSLRGTDANITIGDGEPVDLPA